MVGTAGKSVGRFLSITLRTVSSSKRGSRIILAPRRMLKFITTVIAKTWNSGRTPTMISPPSSASGITIVAWAAFAVRLAWVSIAPFDVPVVPPVY